MKLLELTGRSVVFSAITILICCLSVMSHAQSLKILDSISKTPIDGATVTLINSKNNNLIFNGSTDRSGIISFKMDDGNIAYISITSIGYKKYSKLINLLQDTIFLSPSVEQLKEVKIKTKQNPLKLEGNKMLFDISKIPKIEYLNTADLINELPFFKIEDNQVKMMNETVSILVNGKPNILYSTADGLKALPPHAISKMELTLSPSARSNGAKTLNITLKRDYFLGLNGSLQGDGSPQGINTMASASYWKKKFGFDASVNYTHNNGRKKINTKVDYLLNDKDLFVSTERNSKLNNGDIGFSTFYNIDSLNTLDLQLSLTPSQGDNVQNSLTIINSGTATLSQKGNFVQENRSFGTSVSVNYTKKMRKDGNAFYLLSNLNNSDVNQSYNILEDGVGTGAVIREENYRSNAKGLEGTFEVLLQRNSNKNFQYTVGSKIISRNNQDQYMVDQNGIVDYTPFQMKQLVSSSYLDMDWIIKKFTLHTGSRLDYNRNIFSLPTGLIQKATNFVPNISLSYNLNDITTILFTYTRALNRPGVYQFTPVPASTNTYEREIGNPNLYNQVSNDWGLQYYGNYKLFRLGIDFNYNAISGLFREISTIGADNIIQIVPINVDLNEDYKLGLSVDFNLFPKIRISHYNNVVYAHQKVGIDYTNRWVAYLNDKIDYQIDKKNRIGVKFTAFSPNITPQGIEQSMDYLNFGINYGYFFNLGKSNPSMLGLSLSNPTLYKGTKSYYEINSPDFIQRTEGRTRNPVVGISFRVMLKGKVYNNRNFNKEKSIQNSDLYKKNGN